MNEKVHKVVFLGSKKLGYTVLKTIYTLSHKLIVGIITIDDRDDARTQFEKFDEFSKRNRIPLYVARDEKYAEKILSTLKPDLCFVVNWYWLIGHDILTAIPYGFIGIHNSLLPKYRGGSPLVWAIINGENQAGFSLFKLRNGIDNGKIWMQETVDIGPFDYIGDVLAKLERRIETILKKKYTSIINGTIEPFKQDDNLATYYAQRYPSDGKIDWHKPAQYIYNFIRAQSDPYPGAFIYYGSQIMRIWKAALFSAHYVGIAGQVVKISNNGVYVICGDNKAIILQEVEISGKRYKAQDYIRSDKIQL